MVQGLSGSNLSIGIALVLRDSFTAQSRVAANALNQLDDQARRSAMRQMEMQRNINATGAAMGLLAIRGMAQWTKVGAEFGYTMKYVNEIADKKGGKGLEELSRRAKTLGADTMFSARQVADGMKYMAMAGMDTESIYNNINAAVSLAGSTMERLEGKGGAADIMTNIMRGFGIDGTGEGAEERAMRVADVLSTAVTSANTNLWDLHEGMKYTISTAKDLNVTLEETAAMIMMAGDAGIQGSMAGTATENMLRYVTRAADETRKGRAGAALKQLGLAPQDLKDAKGNLLSISPLLTTIAKRVQGMGNVDKQNLLTDIFGVRGKREASLLLRNMAEYDKYVNKLTNNSGGAATTKLNSMMDTLMGRGIQLSSMWESFQIAFTESIEPILKPILGILTSMLKVFTRIVETPIGKFFTALIAFTIVWKTAIMGYRAVVLTLTLAHARLGSGFMGTTSSVVGGYNAMTGAANRYATAAGRAGMMGGGGVMGGMFGFGGTRGRAGKWAAKRGFGSYTGVASNGAHYSTHGGGTNFISPGSKPQGWSMGAGSALGKANNFAGKASLPAMLAGMGLQMGAGAAGHDTSLGKGLGIAGDTVGWAGTGAMLGSVVPGIGTALGGILGGVGGLLWGLYNRLEGTAAEVDKVKEADSTKNMTPEQWRKKVERLKGAKEGDVMWLKGHGDDPNDPTTRAGAKDLLGRGYTSFNDKNPNQIIINIDGKESFNKVIQEQYFKTMLDLGA